MQNRPNHELTIKELLSLDKAHTGLHQQEAMLKIQEMMEGPSLETMIGGVIVGQGLNAVHAEIEAHGEEEIKAVNAQLKAVNDDVAAKAKAVGAVIEAKNFTKETFAAKQGMFSPAIVARRAEVEAMLDAAAERSASNSDTEEVSSLEVSPTLSPRL